MLLLLVGVAPCARAEEPPPPAPLPAALRAHPLTTALRIDGDLSDWPEPDGAHVARLDRPEQVLPAWRGKWAGPEDASARVAVAVDEDALYLGIAVVDDVPLAPGPRAWWEGDAIELFLRLGYRDADPPPDAYTDDCLQIFLMPRNPVMAWGVAYRGPTATFDDGRLQGVRLAWRERAGGSYDLEARIPLFNLGIHDRGATRLGFAIALDDSDQAPGAPGTYLSWNGKPDLYRRPGNFGTLDLPPRAPRAPEGDPSPSGGSLWIALGVLVAVGAAFLIAGPGARPFSRLGPRLKVVGLGLTGLLALVYVADAERVVTGAQDAVRAELRRLARQAEGIASDAATVGALDPASVTERQRALALLLQGDRVPCLPPAEEVALVPLRDLAEVERPGAATWQVALDRPRAFPLPAPVPAAGFVATIQVEAIAPAERPQTGTHLLGTLTAFAEDGTLARSVLAVPATGSRRQEVHVSLGGERVWRRIAWSPGAGAPAATLVALVAERPGSPARGIALPGVTEDGIPVLGGPETPRLGRTLAPQAEATIALPSVPAADRLWLVLTAAQAFPATLGDEVVARAIVTYEDGPAEDFDLRNGEHVASERTPAGMQRPPRIRSRQAYRWVDAEGAVRTHDAVPLKLDATRTPRTLTVRNPGGVGPVTVVAATLVRSARPGPRSLVGIAPSEEDGLDRAFVREPEAGFAGRIGPGSTGDVRLDRSLGPAAMATPFSLAAPVPPEVREKEQRTRVALLTCLAVALFLGVLLAVDGVERFHRLTVRLVFGVAVAALVPLAATILLVERSNRERIEAEQAARARTVLETARTTLLDTLRRTRETARLLVAQVASGTEAASGDRMQRLVRLYRSTALPEGPAGTAILTAAGRPSLRVDPDPPAPALLGTRFLAERGEPSGFHASPWDGLLVVGSARGGDPEDWLRVTLGLRVDDDFLERHVRSAIPEAGVSLALLGVDGRPLAAAGPDGPGLLRTLRGTRAEVGGSLDREAPAVLARLRDPGQAAVERLAVVDRLATEPFGETAAWLAVGLERRAIDRAVEDQRGQLLWLGLFGLFLVVSVASLTARRVADPVKDLVRVTEAVRRGEFDTVVPPAGADEVGDLTVAFDQMRRTLARRVGDLDLLLQAQGRLVESLDFAQVARTALDLFRERFQPAAAVVLDATSPAGPIAVAAEHGRKTTFADRPFRAAAQGWIAHALASREPVEIRDPQDPRVRAEVALGGRLVEDRPAFLAVPLHVGAETMGLIVLAWDETEGLPGAEERRLLEPLAGTCAIALSNARLHRLASLDDATRLPGATAFEAALRADVERAVAGGPRAVLVRIGLDHLESITHRRGVEASRLLLRALADALRASVGGDRRRLGRLRETDLAVRLPGASREEAIRLAETLRERLHAVEVVPESGGDALSTTVAVGVALCPEDARSVEFLLDAAARAIAAARREGGDRVQDAARLDQGVVDVPPFEAGAVFRSERMVRVVEAARRAAQSDASVLLTGETGTGKEVIADLIHRRSARANRPFVKVNCAAFPETLLESELFGHERGAFTGAERRREGRFELADGGTLFLDEIAEMTLQAQVKLLRVLQERQFTRLGGTRPVDVDVRIVAATNRDLEKAVSEGTLREDLYYRLNVIRLELPPLRERREEIPVLVERFLQEFRRRTGRGPTGLTTAAMDVLYRHPWPGNVRELQNAIERCAVLCEADQAGPEHLRLHGGRSEGASGLAPRAAPRDDLSPRQRQLLDHLARHGRCTNREYYEMTGTSPRTGLRDLQDLISRGLILRDGKRRGAVYRLP